MGIVVNRCAKCGHEWAQSGNVPPRRCPSKECRTVKWRVPPTTVGIYDQIETLRPDALAARRATLAQAKRMLKRFSSGEIKAVTRASITDAAFMKLLNMQAQAEDGGLVPVCPHCLKRMINCHCGVE